MPISRAMMWSLGRLRLELFDANAVPQMHAESGHALLGITIAFPMPDVVVFLSRQGEHLIGPVLEDLDFGDAVARER